MTTTPMTDAENSAARQTLRTTAHAARRVQDSFSRRIALEVVRAQAYDLLSKLGH